MSVSRVEYIADAAVEAGLDRAIRELLVVCFTKAEDEVFKARRFWREPPAHRWFIRDERGAVIAHVAVHDKSVVHRGKKLRIGGIAEVSVRPDHRGHGYVKLLLAAVREWLAKHGYVYAVLFGETKVYTSSGFTVVNNLLHETTDAAGKTTRQPAEHAMVAPLTPAPWPTDDVFLPGKIF